MWAAVSLLAWVTFAVGGVYLWASATAIAACGLLVLAVSPAIASPGETRLLDLALLASLGAIFLQLVPLAGPLASWITPHAGGLRSAVWLGSPTAGPPGRAESLPITVNAPDTWLAFGLAAAGIALFWACRHICEEGGTRPIVRGISVIGLVASLSAIIQRAENQTLIYGYWPALDAGARPFGPFVNRNHFATWVVMACPLVLGYMIARRRGHPPRSEFTQRLASALKRLGSRSTWLAAAACVMTIALLISTSRSGAIGLAAALVAGAWLGTGRGRAYGRLGGALVATLLVIAVLVFVNLNAVLLRVDETMQVGIGGRAETWQDTRTLIHDFWLTGTGLGTYRTAMLVYQQTNRAYFANQAHNQYLQLAAEGGLLIVVPAAVAVLAFIGLCRRRLAGNTSASVWLRIGACAGLAGVAVQSLWETGLRMPANGLLFAVLAAIAVHVSPDPAGPHPSR